MRPLLLSLALLVAACSSTQPRPPPSDRFVYPSGLVHRDVPGSSNGVLYVASANFDRCYDQGTVMAVDLDQVASDTGRLPALGTATNTEPLELSQLNLGSGARVYIQSYAGEMDIWNRPDGSPRLFVPARADGDYVHYIDVPEPTRLACVGTSSDNCQQGNGALSLATVSGQVNDLPRAPAPFGVTVDTTSATEPAKVWVTHISAADSPSRSKTNYQAYVVRLPGDEPSLATEDFLSLNVPNLPLGGSNSVVADTRYVFATGRYDSLVSTTLVRRFLVRVLDKSNPGRIVDPGLDVDFAALEARGLALTPADPVDPTKARRLYAAVRSPDTLLIVNATGIDASSDTPRLTAVGSVSLPAGPTEVKLLTRAAPRSELVVVSCSTAGVVAIYDPDVGEVVAQVQVGEQSGTQTPQPFGLAVQQQGNAARIFVSNFGDGRVSVIDIADLANPQLARLVAHIGARQDAQGSSACQEVKQ